ARHQQRSDQNGGGQFLMTPRGAIDRGINFYNHQRPHTAHSGRPPAVVYFNNIETDQYAQAAA
ncbi:hypothetical protein, partial [Paracoccus rhizosphaerae]